MTVDNMDQACAMGAMNHMTAEELAHLRFNDCISARKLAILSNSGVRGIVKGLKADDWKCQIRQHTNIIRSTAAPAVDPAQQPKDLMCDCAGEYDSQEFRTVLAKYPGTTVRHSNAHEQSASSMAEKMVDRMGRMLRTTVLESQLSPEFWGAAAILATNVYNCMPHSALNNQSPFYCSKGVHPDLSFFRPFDCSMVVHWGKDLVEHHKLAPRGEKCVYLGCGMHTAAAHT
jgi:hypothetical protein